MYCTYLISYMGNKLPMFYIGSTSIQKIKSGYMGSISSKRYKNIWKNELILNKKLFKIRIISKHDTRQEAFDKENKLQRLLKVKNNIMYVNMCYAIDNNDVKGENNPMFGKIRNDSKKRMLENNPMKNDNIRQKMIATRKLLNKPAYNKGKSNPKQSLKMLNDNPMKNEMTKIKMVETMRINNGGEYPTKNTIWVANIITRERKRVTNLVFEKLDLSWIKLSNKLPIPDIDTTSKQDIHS